MANLSELKVGDVVTVVSDGEASAEVGKIIGEDKVAWRVQTTWKDARYLKSNLRAWGNGSTYIRPYDTRWWDARKRAERRRRLIGLLSSESFWVRASDERLEEVAASLGYTVSESGQLERLP